MSLRSNKLLKYLPLEIQYQELKASEEALQVIHNARKRGQVICFALSICMAAVILHPGLHQRVEQILQLDHIGGINFSSSPNRPNGDKIADALVNYARSKGWQLRTGKHRYNIFYTQGMLPNGARNDNAPNQFNDSRFLVEINPTPRLIGAWEASVEPGNHYTKQPMNKGGAAHIRVPGYYQAWRIGMHKGREQALVQVVPVDIVRDRNRNGKVDNGDYSERALIGANQHSAYDQQFVDGASAGCPVGRTSKGHMEFMGLLQQDADYKVSKDFIFSTGFVPGNELRF
ncbi:hypothetical protein CAL7716_104900 (plasmid) [Calothrix sp. PCC 7716]|nr:hypothetical protein CAL7716_104900 [Calothrix sp. PCC 7716]